MNPIITTILIIAVCMFFATLAGTFFSGTKVKEDEQKWIDVNNEDPVDPGLYPVLICHEVREGFFPTAAYWDDRWKMKCVTHFINKKFAKYEDADLFAKSNDPEW